MLIIHTCLFCCRYPRNCDCNMFHMRMIYNIFWNVVSIGFESMLVTFAIQYDSLWDWMHEYFVNYDITSNLLGDQLYTQIGYLQWRDLGQLKSRVCREWLTNPVRKLSRLVRLVLNIKRMSVDEERRMLDLVNMRRTLEPLDCSARYGDDVHLPISKKWCLWLRVSFGRIFAR